MQIFQIDFSKIRTSTNALDWITSSEVNGGKNEDRYWLIRTNITVNNPQNDAEMHNLLLFLDFARVKSFQTVQIMKNA